MDKTDVIVIYNIYTYDIKGKSELPGITCIVHLFWTEWSAFPVGHLLSLVQRSSKTKANKITESSLISFIAAFNKP